MSTLTSVILLFGPWLLFYIYFFLSILQDFFDVDHFFWGGGNDLKDKMACLNLIAAFSNIFK